VFYGCIGGYEGVIAWGAGATGGAYVIYTLGMPVLYKMGN